MLKIGFDIEKKFDFIVVPRGVVYKQVAHCPYEGGICNRRHKKKSYLAFDNKVWNRKKIRKTARKYHLHEIAHIIVSKYNNSLSDTLSEGLAEVIPIYILGYKEHHKNLSYDEFVDIEIIDKDGALDDDFKTPAQEKNTYKSAYLFVRKVIKEIEKKYKVRKKKALIILLEELKKAKSKPATYKRIAKLIDVDVKKLKSKEFVFKKK